MEFEEAKKELKSYQSMEKAIEQMQAWVDDKKYNSNKLTSTISSQPRGSPIHQDGMAENISKAIDLESDVQERINEMKLKQKEILRKVLQLEQPFQNVIFSIYIVGNTIDASASIVGFSRIETYRKRDKAIELYMQIK